MEAPTRTKPVPALVEESSQPRAKPALDATQLRLTDAYWRAANYLSVGQIYLYDNPLLREPLTLAHVKPLVVGWLAHAESKPLSYWVSAQADSDSADIASATLVLSTEYFIGISSDDQRRKSVRQPSVAKSPIDFIERTQKL